MKKEIKKKSQLFLTTLVLGMFMFSMMPLLSAQENYNVAVNPGATTESPLGMEDIQPSAEVGGLVSNIQSVVERFVDFLGVKIWKDTSGSSQIMNYDLYAFPTGTTVDLNDLSFRDTFETSESSVINGVTGVWTTFNAVTGSDTQQSTILGEVINYSNGDTLSIDSWEPSVGSYGVYATLNGVHTEFLFSNGCTDEICGTKSEIESYFGVTIPTGNEMSYVLVPGLNKNVIGVRINTDWIFFGDLNGDGLMAFGSEGYGVTAQSGETLAILPSGINYDIYGILPA